MILAPAASEPKVAITKRAGKRNMTHIRKLAGRRKRRRGGFKQTQGTLDLAGLVFQPFRFVLIGCAPAAFVDRQNGGVENTVAQGL
jgi:hypothetical protein